MVRSTVFSMRPFASNADALLYRWTMGRPPRFLTRLTVRQFDVLQICRRFGPGRYVLRRIQKNGCEYRKSFRIMCGSYGVPRRRICWIRK